MTEIEKLSQFNWGTVDKHQGFGSNYSSEEKAEITKRYENTLSKVNEKQIVTGNIIDITEREVVIDIGSKSDGSVSLNEFRDISVNIGDEVEVYLEEQEDKDGQLILSRKKGKVVKAWKKIQAALENDEIIEGTIKRRTRGGLIADVFGIEAFLPGSQIDIKPIRDFDVFVGKTMELKVMKINYDNDNTVVSHKILIEKDLESQRTEILNSLDRGQILEGVVKNITKFGAFIDLGGVDGLLHITDICWGRINHPSELLELDKSIKVVVLDFDDAKKRISLGMKQLIKDPWETLDDKVTVDAIMKGKIVNVADYGAFVEIKPGVEGLIHVSEMSWSQYLKNPQDLLAVGNEIEAKILTIDRKEKKMSLGIKQLTEDPWTREDILEKYAPGTKHKGMVRSLTNFGLFMELEEGIDGLLHISDLSWTRKIRHSSEFIGANEELEVQVLELDREQKRLTLGHKQLEENPWDTFEGIFKVDSMHKCAVINKVEKGAVLELPFGARGFCHNRNLIKEDNLLPEVGDSLDFKVIEFYKEEKRIILSHRNTYSKKKTMRYTKDNSENVKKTDQEEVLKEDLSDKKASAPKSQKKEQKSESFTPKKTDQEEVLKENVSDKKASVPKSQEKEQQSESFTPKKIDKEEGKNKEME